MQAQLGEQQPLQQVQGKCFPYSVYLSGSVQYAVCENRGAAWQMIPSLLLASLRQRKA